MATSFIGQSALPLGLRNNNPGNLRPGDAWQGMIGTNQGFLVFQDIAWGIRALARDLTTQIDKGNDTITALISVYAPPSENNTAAYIAAVASDTGLDPGLQLGTDPDTIASLVRAIMNHELGASYSAMVPDQDIATGVSMAGNQVTTLIQSVPVAVQAAVDSVTGNTPASVDGSGVAVGVAVIGLAGLLFFLIRKKV